MLTQLVRAGAVEEIMPQYGVVNLIGDVAVIGLIIVCVSVYLPAKSMRSVLENRLIATLSFMSSPIVGAYLGAKYLSILSSDFSVRAMMGGWTSMMLFLVWYFFWRPRPTRSV